MEVAEYKNHQSLLEAEFNRRVELNSRYSMRAFAKDIGIVPSLLSDLLSSKKSLTLGTAAKIAESLGYSETEQFHICDLALASHTDESIRKIAKKRLERKDAQRTTKISPLHGHAMDVILKDWYYFAILELRHIKNSSWDPNWIAKHLGLASQQVTRALNDMEKVGIILKTGLKYDVSKDSLTTTRDVPSKSLQRFYLSLFEQAKAALTNLSVKDRDFSSLTVACDERLLPELKNRIKVFRRGLMEYIETESLEKNSVQCLSINLFRLNQKHTSQQELGE